MFVANNEIMKQRLTKAEEEIMLALWDLKEAIVRDVINSLEDPDTPYTTVSTVIRILEKKGFVVMKLGKPIKYIAVSPHEVVERVKKNMKSEADEKVKRLEELKETEVMGELNTLHTQGVELVEPSDVSGSLRGRHNIYNHLELTIRNAEESVAIMTTALGLMRKVEGLKGTFEQIKKRGVKIRIAAPITKECAFAVKDLGEVAEIRNTEAKARFCIVDGKELIFMVLDDTVVHPTYDVGIWVNTPFFASALQQLFDLSWKDMKPAKQLVK